MIRKGDGLVRVSGYSQLVSHLFDSQDRNKIFDAGSLLKLAAFAA